MQEYTWADWLLYFYIYCFVGWVWESCYVSVKKRKLVNRGFMKGPLLPIYGSGAVCVLFITRPLEGNYLLMALAGMTAAAVLEYVTGAVMETLFQVRYWDYSRDFLNLNGYVCLKSVLCWGVMTFLLVYAVHPAVAELSAGIPREIKGRGVFLVTMLASADFATSFKAAIDFRNVLVKAELLRAELREFQQRLDRLEDFSRAEIKELLQKRRILAERMQSIPYSSIRGLLRRNPGAVSRKYTEALEEVRSMIRRHLENKRDME